MSFAVYVLDWAGALMGKGVWVRMYWHEAADTYRDVVDGAGLPIARRRDGWSFLVADPSDVDVLDRLTLDGEIVLERIDRPPRRRRQDDAHVRHRRGPRSPDGRSACPSRGAHGRRRRGRPR